MAADHELFCKRPRIMVLDLNWEKLQKLQNSIRNLKLTAINEGCGQEYNPTHIFVNFINKITHTPNVRPLHLICPGLHTHNMISLAQLPLQL